MTVQGPVKEQQPDGMSHRGGAAGPPNPPPTPLDKHIPGPMPCAGDASAASPSLSSATEDFRASVAKMDEQFTVGEPSNRSTPPDAGRPHSDAQVLPDRIVPCGAGSAAGSGPRPPNPGRVGAGSAPSVRGPQAPTPLQALRRIAATPDAGPKAELQSPTASGPTPVHVSRLSDAGFSSYMAFAKAHPATGGVSTRVCVHSGVKWNGRRGQVRIFLLCRGPG